MLTPHDQYPSIHGKAHRKAPSRVGPPALTRHIGYWMPPSKPGQTFEERRNAWIANIDWYLMSILVECFYRWRREEIEAALAAAEKPPAKPWRPDDFMPASFNVRQMARKPNSEKASPPHAYEGYFFKHKGFFSLEQDRVPASFRLAKLFEHEGGLEGNAGRFETVSFRFYFGRIELKLRAELQSEFFTLSFTASFDMPNEEQAALKNTGICGEVRDHFEAVNTVMKRRFTEARSDFSRADRKHKTRADVEALDEASGFLFDDFWKRIEDEILEPAQTPRFKGVGKSQKQGDTLTNVELGHKFFDFRGAILCMSDENPEKGVLQEPFCWPNMTSLHDDYENADLDKSDVFAYIDAVVPLLDSARERFERKDGHHLKGFRRHGVEYTAATAQDARALYISSLGNHQTWAKHNSGHPVRYVLMTRHKNRWQMGRLVDRLHSAGSFRVASLIDYAALNDAGFELIDLESQLNVAFEGVEQEQDREQTARPSALAKTQCKSRERDWRNLTAQYNKLMREMGEGGLEHRAERSQFYVNAFRTETKALRLHRIEGFQIYDAFVERKLGPTWEYIASLSARSARVRWRLDALRDAVRIELGLAHTQKLRDLQSFAERVGVVPISYYAGHVAEAVLGHVALLEGHGWFHMSLQQQWLAFGTLGGAAMYSSLVFFPRTTARIFRGIRSVLASIVAPFRD